MSKNRGRNGSNKSRAFSNKKGVQMVITPYFDSFMQKVRFTKTTKRLQHIEGKTIVHYDYV